MAKAKILEKQKTSSKNIIKNKAPVKKFNPLEYMLNRENILRAIAECLQKNDLAGIVEVVKIYKKAVKEKKRIAKTGSSISEKTYWEIDCENTLVPQIAYNPHKNRSTKKYCK